MSPETKATIAQSFDAFKSRKKSLMFNGLVTAIQLLLIHFKVQGIVAWSWFWITLPIWGGWAFLFLVLPFFILVALLIITWLERRQEKRATHE